MSVEAQRAATRFDQSTLFSIVKRLKFKSSPSVPSVLLEDGKPASSHHEEQSKWLRHHAKQLGGSVLTEAQYAQSCKIERAAEQVMTAGNLNSVEILDQVAEVIAELPNKKTQGEDSVPNEILKAGGQPVCSQLSQLCSKANELAAVPLTWKGGLMVTIPKKQGIYAIVPITGLSKQPAVWERCTPRFSVARWFLSLKICQVRPAWRCQGTRNGDSLVDSSSAHAQIFEDWQILCCSVC